MIPISLTPFDQDGALDPASIPTLTHFYRQSGAAAVIVLGIMGEAHALSDQERELVIQYYVEAAGSLPVIATVSAPATEVAVERARRAQQLGARALMVAPPDGVQDPSLLKRHFERVAKATDLPWVLQDEPVTTGVRLTVDFIGMLAETLPTLQAVKVEEVPTPSKTAAIHAARPDLKIFGGLGGLYLLEELVHGASGSMTGFSYPDILDTVIKRYQTDGVEAARPLFYQYLPLIRYEAQLGVKGIAIRKALFHRRGLISAPTVRAPSAPADPVIADDLVDLVRALGLRLGPTEGAV